MLAWGLGVMVLRPPRGGPRNILFAALTIRAVLLFADGGLSDDLYRYLWEGRATTLGGNPYLHAPADPVWDAMAADDGIRSAVNHPHVPTVYPPLALELFALLSSLAYHPLSIRGFMALCDAGIAWALARLLQTRRLSVRGAWLYALFPLGAIESAVSGHIEAAAILPLVLGLLAWERGRGGLGLVGIAGLLKLLPVLILPTLVRRSPRVLPLLLGLGLLTAAPFIDSGASMAAGLTTYATHWSFNGWLFPVFSAVLGDAARPAAGLLAATIVVAALVRFRDPARVALWVGAAFVLFSPTVHPWYVLWVWVPALATGVRAWTVLAWLAPVAYVVLATLDPNTGRWEERQWPALVQYTPLTIALAVEWWRHWTRPGPSVRGEARATSVLPSQT